MSLTTHELEEGKFKIVMTFQYEHYRFAIFYGEHLVSTGSGTGVFLPLNEPDLVVTQTLSAYLARFKRLEWSVQQKEEIDDAT